MNDAIKGKLLEYSELTLQASNNTKEQFANSPDLDRLLIDACMDVDTRFRLMSHQALASEEIRRQLKDILMGPAGLYEELRGRGVEVGR